jgi:hypothetical protein
MENGPAGFQTDPVIESSVLNLVLEQIAQAALRGDKEIIANRKTERLAAFLRHQTDFESQVEFAHSAAIVRREGIVLYVRRSDSRSRQDRPVNRVAVLWKPSVALFKLNWLGVST